MTKNQSFPTRDRTFRIRKATRDTKNSIQRLSGSEYSNYQELDSQETKRARVFSTVRVRLLCFKPQFQSKFPNHFFNFSFFSTKFHPQFITFRSLIFSNSLPLSHDFFPHCLLSPLFPNHLLLWLALSQHHHSPPSQPLPFILFPFFLFPFLFPIFYYFSNTLSLCLFSTPQTPFLCLCFQLLILLFFFFSFHYLPPFLLCGKEHQMWQNSGKSSYI